MLYVTMNIDVIENALELHHVVSEDMLQQYFIKLGIMEDLKSAIWSYFKIVDLYNP